MKSNNLQSMALGIVVLSFLTSAITASSTCPSPCHCNSDSVDCSNSALPVLPQDFPLNTTILHLQGNELSELWHGVFTQLPTLLEMDLADNDIAYIGAHSFFGMPFLRNLNLARNGIEYLLDNSLSGLRLIELNLNANPMGDLSENAFDNTTVEELRMNKARLRTLPKALFRDMVSTLRILQLSNNQYPLQLPEGIFANIHFSNLVMKNNGIRNLRFLSNASVDKLDLTGNPIGDSIWTGIHHATALKEIFCNGCGIQSINITKFMPSVRTISLEDNTISSISDKSFAKVPNLQTLNLHNNRIRYLSQTFDHHLHKLSVLDLSWNYLDDLKADSIDEISLTYLDLSENSLRTVPIHLKPILGQIRTVVLYGNPLRCNCLMLWFYRWIKSLTWRDTQIWGAECLFPKKAALLQYRLDELACQKPRILKSEVAYVANAKGTNVTVYCLATSEPLPVIELVLPSGEKVVNYPNQNKASTDIHISHQITFINCSSNFEVNCVASNFAGNASKSEIVKTESCDNQKIYNGTNHSETTAGQVKTTNNASDLNANVTSLSDDIHPGNWTSDDSASSNITHSNMTDLLNSINTTIKTHINGTSDVILGNSPTADNAKLDSNSSLANVFLLANETLDPNQSVPLCCPSGYFNQTESGTNNTILKTDDILFTDSVNYLNFTFHKNDTNFTDIGLNITEEWLWFASQSPDGSKNFSYVIDLKNSATSWLRNTLVTILKGCIGFVVLVVSVTLLTVISRVIYYNSNSRMDYNLSKERAEFVRNQLMNTMRIIRPLSSVTVSARDRHEP